LVSKNIGLQNGDPKECLDVGNLEVREKYVAGGEFELAWMATAQHGGTVEVDIVCNGDESYANFAQNRMIHVGGTMYKCTKEKCTSGGSDVIISPDGEWAWSHSQYTRFVHKMKIPDNALGKCTIAWFWWGLQSAG